MRVSQKVIVVLSILLISSCTTLGPPQAVEGTAVISTEMILDANPMVAGLELEDLSQSDPLALNPEMIAFVDSYVNPYRSHSTRLQHLLFAVMHEGTFDLIYDDTTRTAIETFADQRGNCLSFTNMFVAMARHAGLDAVFQEVMIPPDWSSSGQFFIFSQHVNVLVDLSAGVAGLDQIIDFNMYDFRSSYDREVISDQRARAHYFNNMGVEHMLAGDTPLAFAYFRESIRQDRLFSPTWVNLGILNRREGYPDYAEASYLHALEIDKVNLVAMSNLAGFYELQGRMDLAESYRSRVESHRMRNPYYRYELARTAFSDGDYNSSIDHLKFAIQRKDNDDKFYFLMSLSYLMSGDKAQAQRWMNKTEEVAEKAADKQRYHNKFDMLINNGTLD